jgi:hypothetical protein
MIQNTHTNTSVCNPTNEGQSIQGPRGWVDSWSVTIATIVIALSSSSSKSSVPAAACELKDALVLEPHAHSVTVWAV